MLEIKNKRIRHGICSILLTVLASLMSSCGHQVIQDKNWEEKLIVFDTEMVYAKNLKKSVTNKISYQIGLHLMRAEESQYLFPNH